MAGIARIAVAKDTTGHAFGSGILAWTADASYVVSVIATNTSAVNGTIYIYIVPSGQENNQDAWALLAYNLPLPGYNSYETFRFGINTTDKLYVAGSAGMDYFIQGMNQS